MMPAMIECVAETLRPEFFPLIFFFRVRLEEREASERASDGLVFLFTHQHQPPKKPRTFRRGPELPHEPDRERDDHSVGVDLRGTVKVADVGDLSRDDVRCEGEKAGKWRGKRRGNKSCERGRKRNIVESEKLKNSKQELTGRAAEHECASELEDDGEDDGLPEGEGLSADGGGEGVGDVVGACGRKF